MGVYKNKVEEDKSSNLVADGLCIHGGSGNKCYLNTNSALRCSIKRLTIRAKDLAMPSRAVTKAANV
jgi:hypothetical protein